MTNKKSGILHKKVNVSDNVKPLVIFSLIMLSVIVWLYVNQSYDIRGRAEVYPPTPTPIRVGCTSQVTDVLALCGGMLDSSGLPFNCDKGCRAIGKVPVSVGSDLNATNGLFVGNNGSACYTSAASIFTTVSDQELYCMDANYSELKRTKYLFCKCANPSPTPTAIIWPTYTPIPTATRIPTPTGFQMVISNTGTTSGESCRTVCSKNGLTCKSIYAIRNDGVQLNNYYVSGARDSLTCMYNSGTCTTKIKSLGLRCGNYSVQSAYCVCGAAR